MELIGYEGGEVKKTFEGRLLSRIRINEQNLSFNEACLIDLSPCKRNSDMELGPKG